MTGIDPAAVYQQIVSKMPEGLGKQIMTILALHIGEKNRISRARLVLELFGYIPKNSKNSTEDRQMRRTIEELVEQGYPVCSSSGKGGYYLASSKEEREVCIRELISRRECLDIRIRQLRSANKLEWVEPIVFLQPELRL